MAQIDVSPEGLMRLVTRLTREYGDTAAANFALDEQLNLAIQQNQQLAEMVALKDEALIGLHEQVATMGKTIDQMRAAADPDPKNAHRYVRAKRAPRPKKNA